MITKEEVIEKSGLHYYKILNIYLFGSRIYDVSSEMSDYDVLIIAKTPYPEKEIIVDNLNIHILTLDRFLDGLKTHNIRNIECLFSPIKLLETEHIQYVINISGLRHSISHISSNSYVKSKKKLIQGDYYIGIKALFHSLRIILYGIQLINYGKINDWKCANYIWNDLSSKNWTWEELDLKYKPIKNRLMTEFRKISYK